MPPSPASPRNPSRTGNSLLIDNASTDGSTAIAHRWATQDERIRVIHEAAVGIACALNTGLAQVRSTYIARMDADDVSHPERLAKRGIRRTHIPKRSVCWAHAQFISTLDKSEGMRAFTQWQNAILTPRGRYVKRFVDAPLAHPAVMFRRALIEQHGTYNTDSLPEDRELWLRWMDAGVRFAKLPEELLTWNDHAHRLSRTHANYSVDAFFATKAHWLAKWLQRTLKGRAVMHCRYQRIVSIAGCVIGGSRRSSERLYRCETPRGAGLRFHSA